MEYVGLLGTCHYVQSGPVCVHRDSCAFLHFGFDPAVASINRSTILWFDVCHRVGNQSCSGRGFAQ